MLGFLTYLLLVEMAPAIHKIPYWDKLQHIVAFAGVSLFGVLAFEQQAKKVLLALSVYGALMEVLQGLLTTSRQPSVLDWLADNIGIVLSGWATLHFLQWLKQRHGRI